MVLQEAGVAWIAVLLPLFHIHVPTHVHKRVICAAADLPFSLYRTQARQIVERLFECQNDPASPKIFFIVILLLDDKQIPHSDSISIFDHQASFIVLLHSFGFVNRPFKRRSKFIAFVASKRVLATGLLLCLLFGSVGLNSISEKVQLSI